MSQLLTKINFNKIKKQYWFGLGFLMILLFMILYLWGWLIELGRRYQDGEEIPKWLIPLAKMFAKREEEKQKKKGWIDKAVDVAVSLIIPALMLWVGGILVTVVTVPIAPVLGVIAIVGGLITLSYSLWSLTSDDEQTLPEPTDKKLE